jgi:transposase
MSQSRTLCIGMDVHKDAMAVAYVAQDHGAEVPSVGTIGTRQRALDPLRRKRQAKASHRSFIYEAGPCGYGLYRSFQQNGDACWVVAPALIPQKAGERVKTDRRAAIQLARLARSGALPPVYVPQVADDAIRELPRAREEVISALQEAQFRLTAFWLRQEIRYAGRAHWGPAHLRWLAEVVWPPPAPHLVFQE